LKIKWSNRLEIVEGFLRMQNLDKARDYAKELLTEVDAEIMLSEDEIEYLKIVVAFKSIEDYIKNHKKGL